MSEQIKEIPVELLKPRITPIEDEVLEIYVLQINEGERNPEIPRLFPHLHLNPSMASLETYVQNGMSFVVAAAIAKYEIPDNKAKNMLAVAFENNINYLLRQPMVVYPKIKEAVERECLWMRNAAKRLRGEEI